MNNFRQNTNFNRTDIMNLLGKVRETLLKKDEKGINFDSTFSDTDIKNLTGLNRAAFENLLTYLSSIRDTGSKCEDLFGYLPHKIENRFIE